VRERAAIHAEGDALGRTHARMDRPLADRERAVLMKVLDEATFDGAPELRAQVGATKVVRAEPMWLDLEVSEDAPAVAEMNGPIPVRAFVKDESGEFVAELLVWTTDGRLSALEFAWVTDERPASLPAPDAIEVRRDQTK
jgi:hypothetical protein